jgi:Holliday junction resolvasome RuvABC endonuclease subunit
VDLDVLPSGGILALDLAGVVGVAYGLLTERNPAWGCWHLPRIGGEGARYAAFENELSLTLTKLAPTAIVLESTLPLGAMNNYQAAAQAFTLRGFSRSEAWRHSIAISEIDSITVRTAVLGTGRFRRGEVKAEVLAWCRRRGWLIDDHNAGDALLVWEWHRRQVCGIAPIAGPLFREAAA